MPLRRRRPPTLLATTLAVLALALVACGGDDDDTEAGATTTTAETGTGTAADAGNTVTIDMTDYAFDVSGPLQAGTSTVVMKNSGEEVHMAAFGLLKEGKALADVQEALQAQDESAFGEVFEKEMGAPGGILTPGQTQEVTTPFLDAGTYVLMCFIPTAGEPVPHVAKGMVNTLEVTEGDAEVTPEADATYAIDMGKIDGPDTLPAGEATLAVDLSGDDPHEFVVARKKDPASSFEDIEKAFTELFESETPPPKGYAEDLPADIVGNVLEIEAGTDVFMTVDLEPGSYFIGCILEPDEEEGGAEAPSHANEIMEVTVS